ncbi:exopolysaccharide biosynthesis polyprenyl glycosylphosphotransferase [uncultured Pseudoteredinibacter sp.]|uniref:exopolysaccharide biosynthesis polyprenyl glycosylphosphotransferase n=1 Tax=uncultured Pseudoteredinibacter sp. TaxID=1641701 RepID=UPI002613F400|nr:exopolysaccharide biosynthesis polyprenyl glycosylphosphotransferase [uncultured Pseudoteredinibacter sp.]
MESQGNHAANMAGEHIANNNIQQAGLNEPAFGAAVNSEAIQQAILPQAGVDVPQGRRLLKNNQNLVAFLQLACDIAWVVASLCTLAYIKMGAISSDYRVLAVLSAFAIAFVYSSQGIHRRSTGHFNSVLRISIAWATTVALLAVLGFITKTSVTYSREVLLVWFATAWAGQIAAYFAFHYLTRMYRAHHSHSIPTLVIGSGAIAQQLVNSLNRNPWVRDNVVATIKVEGEPDLQPGLQTSVAESEYAAAQELGEEKTLDVFAQKRKRLFNVKLNRKLANVPIIGKLSSTYLNKPAFTEFKASEATPHTGSDPKGSDPKIEATNQNAAPASFTNRLSLVVNHNKNQAQKQKLEELAAYTEINHISSLIKIVEACGIKRIYIALPMLLSQQVSKLNIELMDANVDIIWAPDISALNLVNHSVREVGGVPLISLNESPLTSSRLSTVLKDLMDRSIALLALIALSPIMLTIAALVKLSSKGPVIFKQQRHGWDGSIIEVWKFRSMRQHDEAGGEVKQATKNDDRVTPIGKFIRRTSIDELPQLINVLQGRMSLVGPRPHAVAHNHFYSKKINRYLARHRIKPGITGLAQVSGCRGETETLDKMEKRVEFDMAYINNWSLWLDMKILAKTPFTLFAKDIY